MPQVHIKEIYELLENASRNLEVSSVQPYVDQPFKALIASMISTQTKEERTIVAVSSLFNVADNPYDIILLSKEKLASIIAQASFYNIKAKNILKVCKRVIENGGHVPQTMEELIKFEGVGWKVAALTLEIGYNNSDNICVDTHVDRVSKRLGLVGVDVKKAKRIDEELRKVLPREYWKSWNGLMVSFGREICKSIGPKCSQCFLGQFCPKIGVVKNLSERDQCLSVEKYLQREPGNILLLSWNVNSIRSIQKKNFMNWLMNINPDILCLQETKAEKSQLSSYLAQPSGYYAYWNGATKRGYSGTALLSRKEPLSVEFGLGVTEFDQEGRTIIARYPDFILINCYFPNGGRDHSRLAFKLAFYDAFLTKCEQLRTQGDIVIFCGDVNTAHREIDLARPKPNKRKTGFLPEERAWLNEVIKSKYVDTFRHFYPSLAEQYTWWSGRTIARERNVGWRLDYFFIVTEAIERVTDAIIMSEVNGSDHCPVGIHLKSLNWWEGHIKECKPTHYQPSLF